MTLAKTRRLAALFPDAYAASDPAALLHRLLDVFGAELTRADDGVKRLLKSHWVAYATGPALDGLAASFNVTRRRLHDGSPEPDAAFRQRLRAVVPMFTGGGTVQAVRGAVRSALGLPFDLGSIPLSKRLRDDLEALVVVREYTATSEPFVAEAVPQRGRTELRFTLDSASASAGPPHVTIRLDRGTGWSVRLERLDGPGLRSTEDLFVPAGTPLVLQADGKGIAHASLDQEDVSSSFTTLDGVTPASMPLVPPGRSDWRITVHGVSFESGKFDDHAFGPPDVHLELRWPRFRPLTFEVYVPYHLQAAVDEIKKRHGYTGQLFVFEGLPRETIQEVVDDTRAAGVEGSVHFTLAGADRLDVRDRLRISLTHRAGENADLDEALQAGSIQRAREDQRLDERTKLGGVFNVSKFDDDAHGFH